MCLLNPVQMMSRDFETSLVCCAGPSVYLDDMSMPILSVPLAPPFFLRSGSTRAWIGFTSANSGNGWAATDVLNFTVTTTP